MCATNAQRQEHCHRLHAMVLCLDPGSQVLAESSYGTHSLYMVWCGVVWCGVVWCGVVWCGVVWCGVVWCGVVWCGVWCEALFMLPERLTLMRSKVLLL